MNFETISDPRLTVRRLGKHLAMVVGLRRGRFPRGNVFLVEDQTNAIIDTGCGIELLQLIKKSFHVDCVINSHGHIDHSAGNSVFSDAALYAPEQGKESHGNLMALSERFFAPDEQVEEFWRQWAKEATGFEDSTPTHWFGDGHVFDFGNLKLNAIHTPGHTKDHYCFFDATDGTLLSFDIDLTTFGPWYGNKESELGQFRESMKKVSSLNPALVATSHAEPVRESIPKRFRSYSSVFDKREKVILERLSNGIDIDQLVESAPIYGKFPYVPDLLKLFEQRMIVLHLEEMQNRGLVRERDGSYFRI
jgi:glyoxylase-like metal-dependent hydrolase (beta-lactamase superfamily II)